MAVIQSKIVSLGTYGGEWVGMCQKRTDIIQSEVNKALRLALGSPSNSHLHASRIMSWELGIPTVEEHMADLWVHLWQKAPHMKTWISVLANKENQFHTRGRTWLSQTACFVKTAKSQTDPPVMDLYHTFFFKVLKEEGRMVHYPPHSDEESEEVTLQRVHQWVRLRIIGRSFENTRQNDNEATRLYLASGFDSSRRFLKAAAYMPSLSAGILWLVRLRTSAWWTSRHRKDYLTATGGDHSHLPRDRCPLCQNDLGDGRLEVHHILLDCPAWHE